MTHTSYLRCIGTKARASNNHASWPFLVLAPLAPFAKQQAPIFSLPLVPASLLGACSFMIKSTKPARDHTLLCVKIMSSSSSSFADLSRSRTRTLAMLTWFLKTWLALKVAWWLSRIRNVVYADTLRKICLSSRLNVISTF